MKKSEKKDKKKKEGNMIAAKTEGRGASLLAGLCWPLFLRSSGPQGCLAYESSALVFLAKLRSRSTKWTPFFPPFFSFVDSTMYFLDLFGILLLFLVLSSTLLNPLALVSLSDELAHHHRSQNKMFEKKCNLPKKK